MPCAEVITIGTEILLGEIVDTNSQHILRALRREGVDVYRTMTVGDNLSRIQDAMESCLSRADVVITTGGLGPTVDDLTRKAAARVLGVDLVFQEDLWLGIRSLLRDLTREITPNNKRQAYLPQGAVPLQNSRGTAPAFLHDGQRGILIALPGVPPEMTWLLEEEVLPWLRTRFELSETIITKSLAVEGIGESKVDDLIAEFERFTNPTVGLAAHKGWVEVRITAKADDTRMAERLIKDMEGDLSEHLAPWLRVDLPETD